MILRVCAYNIPGAHNNSVNTSQICLIIPGDPELLSSLRVIRIGPSAGLSTVDGEDTHHPGAHFPRRYRCGNSLVTWVIRVPIAESLNVFAQHTDGQTASCHCFVIENTDTLARIAVVSSSRMHVSSIDIVLPRYDDDGRCRSTLPARQLGVFLGSVVLAVSLHRVDPLDTRIPVCLASTNIWD